MRSLKGLEDAIGLSVVAAEIDLNGWQLPVILSKGGALFPMELCNIAVAQRYPFKLEPQQVSEHIPRFRIAYSR